MSKTLRFCPKCKREKYIAYKPKIVYKLESWKIVKYRVMKKVCTSSFCDYKEIVTEKIIR